MQFQPNLEILTKSALVYRDVELLKKFKNLRVGISLNSLDSKVSKLLEPGATLPKGRIEVLKKLYTAGIKTYLFISPIFPEITDYKAIIKEIGDYVDEILFADNSAPTFFISGSNIPNETAGIYVFSFKILKKALPVLI